LVQLLLIRELADQITDSSKPGDVIVSAVNPGFVKTDVMRHATATFRFFLKPYAKLVARSAEVGARTLLSAATGGKATHGQYLGDCEIAMWVSYILCLDFYTDSM
jgi:retinol dehydrogenase-12